MADEEINRKENSFHEENEFILDTDLVIKCSDWNPLHVAASRGLRGLFKRLLASNPELAEALDSLVAASGEQQELFKKLLHGNPELAEALDSQQRSLLHLASAKGHIDIVKALTEVRPEMCLARDRDGANPLHVAAMRGKVEVLDVLFQANPHAARARVDRGERETILHLCVKYNKLAFLKQLLEKFKSDEFVNAKDDGGNTILHLAVSDQKFEIIDLVLKKTKIDVNVTNAIKQTAMDIHYLRQGTEPEGADRDIEDLLLKFHAKREKDTIDPKWITEQRNALIIVAVLLATIAFQAGVTPPGGVWAEDSKEHRSGEAMMAHNHPNLYRYFLRSNTNGFVASLSTILLLISEFPFAKRRYVWLLIVIMCLTITSMALTYAYCISVITPKQYREALSHTILVGVLVWCSVIAILVLVHTIRLIANNVGERKGRCQAVKRLHAMERLHTLGRAITGRERKPLSNQVAPTYGG